MQIFKLKTRTNRKLIFRVYKLPLPFQGNNHVVYNGSFYYQAQGLPQIIRFFLNNETSVKLNVSRLDVKDNNFLYANNHSYLDFSVDDNGLWVIFPVPDANNTAVMKVTRFENAKKRSITFFFLGPNRSTCLRCKFSTFGTSASTTTKWGRCSSSVGSFMPSITPQKETQKSDSPSICTIVDFWTSIWLLPTPSRGPQWSDIITEIK